MKLFSSHCVCDISHFVAHFLLLVSFLCSIQRVMKMHNKEVRLSLPSVFMY